MSRSKLVSEKKLTDVSDAEILDCVKSNSTKPQKTPSICFFPPIRNQEQFNSHFHRAGWYLPRVVKLLESVKFGVSSAFRTDQRPDYMATDTQSTDHIKCEEGVEAYVEALRSARIILVWDSSIKESFDILGAIPKVETVFNVDTDDIESYEYGNYPKVLWRLMTRPQRDELLDDCKVRFADMVKKLKTKGYTGSVAFGTGPSIDRCYEFDLSDKFTVVCNSTVQSDALLDHIQPDFVCAGDVVSHLGISLYAEKFRKDLEKAMVERQICFFTTAQYGFLLMQQYPHLKDKIFLCNQTADLPVFDLLETWELPKLDSTLNIHMLPLCGTFSDKIYIIGCDGKDPNPKRNEDFWAHSGAAQYHDLVDTGHTCHPTFDKHRQKSTFSRFIDSTATTLALGEQKKGKSFASITPSFTLALAERQLASHQIKVAPHGRVFLV